MYKAFLLLGSNQGDKKNLLEKAICSISSHCGEIVTASSLFFSESWGYNDENYLNQAVEIATKLSPQELLAATQTIEKQLGRVSKTTTHYEARPIDIDILFFDNLIINTDKLTIPHPRMHLRNFVLQPMSEIAPDFSHPILHKKIKELAKDCKDTAKVWK